MEILLVVFGACSFGKIKIVQFSAFWIVNFSLEKKKEIVYLCNSNARFLFQCFYFNDFPSKNQSFSKKSQPIMKKPTPSPVNNLNP